MTQPTNHRINQHREVFLDCMSPTVLIFQVPGNVHGGQSACAGLCLNLQNARLQRQIISFAAIFIFGLYFTLSKRTLCYAAPYCLKNLRWRLSIENMIESLVDSHLSDWGTVSRFSTQENSIMSLYALA